MTNEEILREVRKQVAISDSDMLILMIVLKILTMPNEELKRIADRLLKDMEE